MKKFLIKVNGNQYEVEVEEIKTPGAGDRKTVEAAPANAAPANAEVQNTSVSSGAATITAPMPGTIIKINVNSGDVVSKGQVLLILEAMKMENEITAPADGKVVSVNVTSGASVNVGDVLVSLA